LSGSKRTEAGIGAGSRVVVDFGELGILESVVDDVDMLDDELREEFMRGGLLFRLLECLLLLRCFGVSLL